MKRAVSPRLNRVLAPLAMLVASFTGAAYADSAPYDLPGPQLEAKVTRAGATLPMSQVPNLATGDHLWLKADLPRTQSAPYVMVIAFLRGSTNPPPKSWFMRCNTWTPECTQQGLNVTVPDGAQQVLVFLAPQTGGDFRTLMNAVRGRPGAFVRASQDLNQAALDRSRLESYLSAIRALSDTDPARLKETAPLLARSLAVKVDEKCMDRVPALQAPCLMQAPDSLILNDGHSTSIVQALTSGPASDLAMEATYTPQLSYGYYSPYVASVLDIARIFDAFQTAAYQYIPALVSQQGDRLKLTLNTPPSFHNPKSVLVAALPAIETAQPPPLHAVNPKDTYCASKSSLVLPVEGAPLVFSTGYAHDMTLRLHGDNDSELDLPAKADAEQGGFTVDTTRVTTASLGNGIRAALHGRWGFEDYDGPTFQLMNSRTQTWEPSTGEAGALIVGRDNTLRLHSRSVKCLEGIVVKDAAGNELKSQWKISTPTEVEMTLPLQQAVPGSFTLLVSQYGGGQPQAMQLHAFAEAAHLDSLTIHAGDSDGVLTGSRLDEVATLLVRDIPYATTKLSSNLGRDELTVATQDPQGASVLKTGESVTARIALKDGRILPLKVVIAAPRPRATLIDKSIESPSVSGSRIRLTGPDELPQDGTLTFSLRAGLPARFSSDESIQVATLDESLSTTLSIKNGGLTLEDPQVAVATLNAAAAFGHAAFGPLRFRVLSSGAYGDWQSLVTLVRLPVLRDLTCPTTAELACKLSGSNLFLLGAVSGESTFAHAVQVPDGFPGTALPVPHPLDGKLYVRLRDDPSAINVASLSEQLLTPSVDEIARAPARQAALRADHDSRAASDPNQPPQNAPPASSHPAPDSHPASAPQPSSAGSKNAAQGDVPHTKATRETSDEATSRVMGEPSSS